MARTPKFDVRLNRYSANDAFLRGVDVMNHGGSYLWGGKTPYRFDCSGFVCYCYGLPSRGSDGMPSLAGNTYHLQARSVSGGFKKGDIVYWRPGQSGEYGHVGIYTGDEWKHAPGHGTGAFMQSQGPDGHPIGFGGNGGRWKHILRPPEGFGIYIESFS